MTNKNTPMWFSDRPLTDLANDKLGNAKFAEDLAKSIRNVPPIEGLVVALHGDWGSGKSTVLEFVIHYLKDAKDIAIVRFNPWWFSGQQDLVRNLFKSLQVTLGSDKWKNKFQGLTTLTEGLAEAVSIVPIPGSDIPKKITAMFPDLNVEDVEAIKRKIEDKLRRGDVKILIVIDDIDRLVADEIRQIFQAIKAVANFPNVIYLLAFDRNIVVSALNQIQGDGRRGEDYLEKIVQVSFELPVPDTFAVSEILKTELYKIMPKDEIDKAFDDPRWQKTYITMIEHFIRTLRNVKRLSNTLLTTYAVSNLKGEVNVADFIIIEVLRLFCPEIYSIIRDNKLAFVEGGDAKPLPGQSNYREFHRSWLQNVVPASRGVIRELVTFLFPKLETIWEDNPTFTSKYYNERYPGEWTIESRICSLDTFDVYFRLSLSTGDISNLEMRTILSLARDAHAFSDKLLELASTSRSDGVRRISIFLDKLSKQIQGDNIEDRFIPQMIRSLFDVGDQLIGFDETDFWNPFDRNKKLLINEILPFLLERLDYEKRYSVLKISMEQGQANVIIMWMINALRAQHKNENKRYFQEKLIIEEHVSELEVIALKKLHLLSQSSSFIESKDFGFYREYWWILNNEEADNWVRANLFGDIHLIDFIADIFLTTHPFEGINGCVMRSDRQTHIEIHEVNPYAKKLLESNQLDKNQRKILEAFLELQNRADDTNN